LNQKKAIDMIDFFHAAITDLGSVKLINDKIKFIELGDLNKNEQLFPRHKKKWGLKFSLIKKQNDVFQIEILGSLHKFYNIYFNNADHNYDDFTFIKVKLAIVELSTLLSCDAIHMILKSYEFGLNIRCGIPSNHFIHKSRLYDKVIPVKLEEFPNQGLMKTYEKTDYLIKIYNKNSEAKLHKDADLHHINDLIRFEVKFTRSRESVKKTGIGTMADFSNKNKFKKLCRELRGHWTLILMEDTLIPPKALSPKEKTIFEKAIRTDYFYDPMCINFEGKRRAENKRRFYASYIKILQQYDLLTAHSQFLTLIENKCNDLMRV